MRTGSESSRTQPTDGRCRVRIYRGGPRAGAGRGLLPRRRFRAGKPRHRSPAVRGARPPRPAARWSRWTTGWRRSTPIRPRSTTRARVLRWVAANAKALGVDPARLAVAGSSAGAALAASLAQRSRRRLVAAGGVPAAAPTGARRPGHRVEGGIPHQSGLRRRGRRADVAPLPGPAGRVEDAVPARRDGFAGLPPALITCAEIDPFRDEAIDYALRLLRAGVSTELHVFPRHLPRVRFAAARLGWLATLVRAAG